MLEMDFLGRLSLPIKKWWITGLDQIISLGREIHKSINSSPAGWNLFVHNALVSMYERFGEVDVARSLFDKMLEKDVVS